MLNNINFNNNNGPQYSLGVCPITHRLYIGNDYKVINKIKIKTIGIYLVFHIYTH